MSEVICGGMVTTSYSLVGDERGKKKQNYVICHCIIQLRRKRTTL